MSNPVASLVEQVRALRSELKELSTFDLRSVDPEELATATVELHAAQASLDAQVVRATHALAATNQWAVEGAASPAGWVESRAGTSRAAAARCLKWGRTLAALPELEAAYEAGELSTAKVQRILAARNPRTADVMAEHAALLVGWATRLPYREVDRMMSEWSLRADPDGPEQSRGERRDAWLSESVDGMFLGKLTLDPVRGAVVWTEHQRLEQQLFDADWAEAKERLGRAPRVEELRRTPGQRRADAFVEMAKRSAAMPPGAKQARVLLSILMGPGPFRDLSEVELTHRPIPPGAVREWLDDALFERIVFDGPDRVLSVSHRREFPDAVRRAVQVRDRRCTGDGGACAVPALCCDVDHAEPWTAGGETSEANGQTLCDTHNTRKGAAPGRRRPVDPDRGLRWLADAFGGGDGVGGGSDALGRSDDGEGGPDPPQRE